MHLPESTTDGTTRTLRGQLEIYAQSKLILLTKLSIYARVNDRDCRSGLWI